MIDADTQEIIRQRYARIDALRECIQANNCTFNDYFNAATPEIRMTDDGYDCENHEEIRTSADALIDEVGAFIGEFIGEIWDMEYIATDDERWNPDVRMSRFIDTVRAAFEKEMRSSPLRKESVA